MLTDNVSTMAMNAPTATGVTFTQRQVDSTASSCWAGLYTGVVNTGGAITVTSTPTTANSRMHGGVAVVCPAADGYSLAATPNSVDSHNAGPATPSATINDATGSLLVACNGDWNAVDGASRAYLGTVAEDSYVRNATAATFYFWHQTAVGPTSDTIGLSTPGGQRYTVLAVEVLAPAAAAVTPQPIVAPSAAAMRAATW
jgi:hypothetical protein